MTKAPKKQLPVPASQPPLRIPTQAQLAAAIPPSQLTVKQISDLAAQQVALEDEIAGVELKLKGLQERLRILSVVTIPTACEEAGVMAIMLPGGTKVEVVAFLAANIKEEDRPVAFKWLRANKAGSIIKNEYKIVLGKGQDAIAKQVTAAIEAINKKLKKQKLPTIPVERKESVNWQTLQAFVKEKLQAGKALPPEINVTKVPTAKVIRPKED